jgi:hypothetical protein
LGFVYSGLFGALGHSIFEFVWDFDLPAKANRYCRARAVCAGDSRYFHIRMLFKAWQAGIRISNLEVPIQEITA